MSEDMGSAEEFIDESQPMDPSAADSLAPQETNEEPIDENAALSALVAERTEDLQRVQAEYVNYKKRVDRDRTQARQGGIEAVLRGLIPVFDAVAAAEDQGELTGGFKLTADELTRVAAGFGFQRFGQVEDEFDPRLHEALMQEPVPGEGEMTLKTILQAGYRIGEQVIRPARVIVAVPDGSAAQNDVDAGTPEQPAGAPEDEPAGGNEV